MGRTVLVAIALFPALLSSAGMSGHAAPAPDFSASAAADSTVKYPAGGALFKFGYLIRQNDDLQDAKRYLGMDVAFGIYLHPLLGFELDVGTHGVEVPVRILGSDTRLPIGVSMVTISEVVQYRWRNGDVPATVYGYAGPGLYMTDEMSGSDLFDHELHYGGGTQVGVGVHVWMLGAEARYIQTRARMGGRDFPIDAYIFTLNGGFR